MTSLLAAARPLSTVAYGAWAVAFAAVAGGAIWLVTSRRKHRQVSLAAVALVTFGVLSAIVGVVAFTARPGDVAVPETGPLPSSTLTPTLSPVPTAPDAPEAGGGGATPRDQDQQAAEPVEIGFEAIGGVEVGDSPSKIESTFGKAAATVETTGPDGKSATSYTYESGGRDFEIFVRDSKVYGYLVRSKGFNTFSGVAVGDSLEKLKTAYPTKLEKVSPAEYVLAGPRSSSVKFMIDEDKVSRIDGGRLG